MCVLFIGDTHLMNGLILPRIEKIIKKHDVKKIIFTGDYTDHWGNQKNCNLYIKDLTFLYDWKQRMISKEIEVVMLAGNHDVPYLADLPQHYSAKIPKTFKKIRKILFSLDLRIAHKHDDLLISHAGYTEMYQVEPWHLESLEERHKGLLRELEFQVGLIRGGSYRLGGPIWADRSELITFPNPDYDVQIVGHTPVPQISLSKHIGIDTFSVDRKFKSRGVGQVLIYKDGFLVEDIDWASEDALKARKEYMKATY